MNEDYQSQLLAILQQYFQDTDIEKVTSIQTLWSGYGEIARYLVPSKNLHYVVKVVNPNSGSIHPRGWDSSFSHQRKLDSYENEQLFYQYYSELTDIHCRVPKTIALGQDDKLCWLVMEDLDNSGFTYRCDTYLYDCAPLSIVKLGIRWLAYFHAKYLNCETSKLWPVGTYWHLATRPDEYKKMPEGQLKESAADIDKVLNLASYQTLVHGDAKLANFCFSAQKNDLAAVDFQYVGRGVGVKDLAYFLGSCLSEKDLFSHAEDLLQAYFSHLRRAISHYQVKCDIDELELQWTTLYPLAWADFNRFLSGWATEHHKRNDYMHQQTELALRLLSDQHETSG